MTSQIKEIPSLKESLCSMIRTFFETLTPDQVLLLLSGTMDDTTRPLLLELISNIINNLSSALQARVADMDAEVTEELVVSSLGNVVTESFKAALDVKAQGQSRSAETFRDMISQEVMVSVQCSMSNTLKEHVTAPKRLDRMLKLVAKMIRAIKRKMFPACTKGEVLEPEEPPTSDELPKYLYIAERIEDGSEGDPEEVSFEGRTVSTMEHDTPDEMEEYDDSGSSMEFVFPSAEVEEEAVSPLAPPDLSLEEMRKNSVLLVLERLVSLTYARSNVKHYMTDPAGLIERLMARTWAAVEDVDFEYCPKTFANLEEAIFKGLVKKWDGEALVLANMKLGSPALEKFVADAVKARLLAQLEKRSCICRFCSSRGRVIGK